MLKSIVKVAAHLYLDASELQAEFNARVLDRTGALELQMRVTAFLCGVVIPEDSAKRVLDVTFKRMRKHSRKVYEELHLCIDEPARLDRLSERIVELAKDVYIDTLTDTIAASEAFHVRARRPVESANASN